MLGPDGLDDGQSKLDLVMALSQEFGVPLRTL